MRRYNTSSIIDVAVDLTAPHLGFFEFRICAVINEKTEVTQDCLDKNLLQMAHQSAYQFRITSSHPRIYKIKLQLPHDFSCYHCVLQWKYTAGLLS